MQKQKFLFTIIILSILFISGCTQKIKPEIPEKDKTTETSTLNTCSKLNGFKCDVGEECNGKWLDASDTFSCCSKACTSTTGEVLTTDIYEDTPENEEIGDLI